MSLPIKQLLRFLLSALFLLSAGRNLCAAPAKKVLAKDSAAVTLREPAKETQEEYYGDEYWRYDRDKVKGKEEPGVFDRLLNDFLESIANSFRSDDNGNSFNPWSILWILLFVSLVVLVILRATNSGVSTIFSGKSKKLEPIDASLEDVDIHGIDFEKEITEAVTRNDYRLAVRLWFLRTLKALSDKELLRWTIDKTNSDYYYELSGSNYQKEFGEVSNVYDYIWYGEFPVDEPHYKTAAEKFLELYRRIK